MLRATVAAIAVLLAGFSGSAMAQDDNEEIVVTGSRLEIYRSWPVPHVFRKHRADFAIVEVTIRDDSRAADQRRNEIMDALRTLQTRARAENMTLALVDDEIGIVREFSMPAAADLIEAGGRADTSSLEIRLRTAIRPDDTLEAIHARVARFVEQAPKPGRIEMSTGSTDLTIVNLEQYRDPMLRDIIAEGRSLSASVGAGQGVEIGGLESQVGFKRTGDLEMTLFLQYTLAVRTVAHP